VSDRVLLRSLIRLALLFVVASFIFVSINVFTQHAPKAHGLRVAYVGSPIAQVFIQQKLDEAAPGAFALRSYPNAVSARAAVLDRTVYGAFIGRKKTALLLTASAAGTGAQQAIEHAFTMMATKAPPGMRGRVTALWTTAFIGSTPIGASIVGAVADAFGGRAALAVGAIACFTVVAAGVIVMVRAHPKAVAGQPERRR